jgi:hypothetical protein
LSRGDAILVAYVLKIWNYLAMNEKPLKTLLATRKTASEMGFGTNYFASGMSFGLLGKVLQLYTDQSWEIVDKKGKVSAQGGASEIVGVKKVSDGLEITFTEQKGKRWLRTSEAGGALPWMGNKIAQEALEGLLEYWRTGDHSTLIQDQSVVTSPVKYLGGVGTQLKPASLGTLWITASGFAIKSGEAFWKKSNSELLGLQIGGQGIYTTGGGWVGGGVGFNGAMKGAAMASMLNALETRVHNDCLMRLSFDDAELNFQVLDITPRDLELKLSPLRLHLERNLGVTSSSTMGLSGTVGATLRNSEKDLKSKLQELKNAFEEGLLDEQEYNSKRAQLLENL